MSDTVRLDAPVAGQPAPAPTTTTRKQEMSVSPNQPDADETNELSEAEISERAYLIHLGEQSGGDAVENWLRAERELREARAASQPGPDAADEDADEPSPSQDASASVSKR
jgi:hypothetical protein